MGKEDGEKQKNGRSYLNIAIILKMGARGNVFAHCDFIFCKYLRKQIFSGKNTYKVLLMQANFQSYKNCF